MKNKVSALLVHSRSDSLQALRSALQGLFVKTESARTCGEAALYLWASRPPHLVFTGIQLSDGTWSDVLELARKAAEPVNVIVVMRVADIDFYTQAIEQGVFDCILHPPFTDFDLAHVVLSAAKDVLGRRKAEVNDPPRPVRAAG